jgi:hypothetical protein
MTEEKLVQLADKIEERSAAGTLHWEQTAESNEFQTTLASFVVRIACYRGNDGIDYAIRLIGSDGIELDSVTDVELTKLARKSPRDAFPKSGFEVMESIFKNAKRQALGVDKALDDILSELDDEPPKT